MNRVEKIRKELKLCTKEEIEDLAFEIVNILKYEEYQEERPIDEEFYMDLSFRETPLVAVKRIQLDQGVKFVQAKEWYKEHIKPRLQKEVPAKVRINKKGSETPNSYSGLEGQEFLVEKELDGPGWFYSPDHGNTISFKHCEITEWGDK